MEDGVVHGALELLQLLGRRGVDALDAAQAASVLGWMGVLCWSQAAWRDVQAVATALLDRFCSGILAVEPHVCLDVLGSLCELDVVPRPDQLSDALLPALARCDVEVLAQGLALLARLQSLRNWRLDCVFPSSWNELVVQFVKRMPRPLSAAVGCEFMVGLARLQARQPLAGAHWPDQPRWLVHPEIVRWAAEIVLGAVDVWSVERLSAQQLSEVLWAFAALHVLPPARLFGEIVRVFCVVRPAGELAPRVLAEAATAAGCLCEPGCVRLVYHVLAVMDALLAAGASHGGRTGMEDAHIVAVCWGAACVHAAVCEPHATAAVFVQRHLAAVEAAMARVDPAGLADEQLRARAYFVLLWLGGWGRGQPGGPARWAACALEWQACGEELRQGDVSSLMRERMSAVADKLRDRGLVAMSHGRETLQASVGSLHLRVAMDCSVELHDGTRVYVRAIGDGLRSGEGGVVGPVAALRWVMACAGLRVALPCAWQWRELNEEDREASLEAALGALI